MERKEKKIEYFDNLKAWSQSQRDIIKVYEKKK